MWNLPMVVGLTLSTTARRKRISLSNQCRRPGQNGGPVVRKGSGSLSLVPLPSLASSFHLRVQEDSSNGSQHTHTPTSRRGRGEEGLAPLFKDTSQSMNIPWAST